MATNNIKYTLNAQLADNTLTPDNPDDRIFTLVSAGTADKQRVISEIMDVNPGLERETIEAVINLEQRMVQKLILSGFHVNMGLYQAVAQFKGLARNSAWNPAENTVYVSMTQGADMRRAIADTTVNVVGEKGSSMYVAGGTDTATRAQGFTATSGRNYTLTGSKLKVEGTDPAVGITLTSAADNKVTPVTPDMWAVNEPKKLIFLIPAGLPDGTYTLTVTTQYGGSGTLLKTPRSITKTLVIGDAPAGGGGSNPGEGQEENPLG